MTEIYDQIQATDCKACPEPNECHRCEKGIKFHEHTWSRHIYTDWIREDFLNEIEYHYRPTGLVSRFYKMHSYKMYSGISLK